MSTAISSNPAASAATAPAMLVESAYQLDHPCPRSIATSVEGLMAATIAVDGVQRSTLNSIGERIAANVESVRNFWRWCAGSPVVDEQDRPQVLFHGTPFAGKLGAFDLMRSGSNVMADTGAIFFTDRRALADHFAHQQIPSTDSSFFVHLGKRGQVIPAYIRLQRPLDLRHLQDDDIRALLDMDRSGDTRIEDIRRAMHARNTDLIKTYLPTNLQDLRSFGYDGLIAWVNPRHGGGVEYAVLDPTQIKSASSNRGSFDPADDDIHR